MTVFFLNIFKIKINEENHQFVVDSFLTSYIANPISIINKYFAKQFYKITLNKIYNCCLLLAIN